MNPQGLSSFYCYLRFVNKLSGLHVAPCGTEWIRRSLVELAPTLAEITCELGDDRAESGRTRPALNDTGPTSVQFGPILINAAIWPMPVLIWPLSVEVGCVHGGRRELYLWMGSDKFGVRAQLGCLRPDSDFTQSYVELLPPTLGWL